MAKRKRSSPIRLVLGATVLVAAAAIGWLAYRGSDDAVRTPTPEPSVATPRPLPGRSEAAASEGKPVQLDGKLTVTANAHDAELGISAAAASLMRNVEMYQWREHCDGSRCSYDAAWSTQPIASRTFREPGGHENPAPRLVSRRFDAQGIRIGPVEVDADLLAAQIAAVDHPVHAAMLPGNLAATFSDVGGVLYAGGDPAHPKVGELRVSYRVVPLGEVSLHGVQRGNRLSAK